MNYESRVTGYWLRVVLLLLAALLIVSAGSFDTRSWAIHNSVVSDKDQVLPPMSGDDREVSKRSGEVDFVSATIKMIASLAFVLAGILLLYWAMKRFLPKSGRVFGGGQLIRTLATSYVGQKKAISIVEVAGEVLVLGISNNHISLLTKIEDKTMVEEIKNAKTQRNSKSSFEHQFKKVSSKFQGKKRKNTLSELTGSVQETVDKMKDI